jgi:hypothetical protein
LVTTGIALSVGRHYWEVELVSEGVGSIRIGVQKAGSSFFNDGR